MMRGKNDPDWRELVESWKRQQEEMRQRIIVRPLRAIPRYIAGADAAFSSDKHFVYAAAVVYDRIEHVVVEVAHAMREAEVPYVPGFLSFREGPAVLEAIGKLRHTFGAICFDGQGYAHPRRCGLASHISIVLNMPGVGVAKSRLIGDWENPGQKAGDYSSLTDGQERIGLVLRTRDGTRPLFVSIGHKVDLDSSRELVLACCTKYRIPGPTRHADVEVGRLKRGELRR